MDVRTSLHAAQSLAISLCLCFACQFPLSEFRWLPESARWLLAKGRVEEAKKCLVQCAKMNGKNEHTSKLNNEVHLLDLFTFTNCGLWAKKSVFVLKMEQIFG